MKKKFTTLAKNVLLPLELELLAKELTIVVAIQEKLCQSVMTTLIFWNEELENIMKIVNLLKILVFW